MKKLSEKRKMQFIVGSLLTASAGLIVVVAVTLPKLYKQEKQIKDILAKS